MHIENPAQVAPPRPRAKRAAQGSQGTLLIQLSANRARVTGGYIWEYCNELEFVAVSPLQMGCAFGVGILQRTGVRCSIPTPNGMCIWSGNTATNWTRRVSAGNKARLIPRRNLTRGQNVAVAPAPVIKRSCPVKGGKSGLCVPMFVAECPLCYSHSKWDVHLEWEYCNELRLYLLVRQSVKSLALGLQPPEVSAGQEPL